MQPVGGANGRWSLLQRAGVLGPPAPAEARADQLVRLLLARYGVLTRDCLQRAGFTAIETRTDLQGLERVTLGRRPLPPDNPSRSQGVV